MVHHPVLLREVIEHLRPKAGDVVVDATAGGGGHSEEILKRIGESGKLIAIDSDPEAIERVKEKFKGREGNITYVNDNFRNIDSILGSLGIDSVDEVLFDLGMSSYQLDDARRGLSFLKDSPLDMRLDRRQGMSAEKIVNDLREAELADVIRRFGEERYASFVAKRICSERRKNRIRTTGELKDIIVDAIGHKYRGQRLHAAARTFQALRIFANDELGAAEEGIEKAIEQLRSGGRICVISFHSLEDRIVKNIFRERKTKGGFRILTKKPVRPLDDEIAANPRSRSAKMRVGERI